MEIRICVKGVSNKTVGIRTILWEYPDREWTVGEFLTETVRKTIAAGDAVTAASLMRVLTAEEIRDSAGSGKVGFGVRYNEKKPDLAQAEAAAVQCFEDGMAALFADGIRYEDADAVLPLHDGSEVTFIRLTFLAGRIW